MSQYFLLSCSVTLIVILFYRSCIVRNHVDDDTIIRASGKNDHNMHIEIPIPNLDVGKLILPRRRNQLVRGSIGDNIRVPPLLRSVENSTVEADPRITGGQKAEYSYPFMAAAIYKHRYFACGATLVASNVILTAAHCANYVHGVLIGRYNLGKYGSDEEYFVVSDIITHPKYEWNKPPVYDFALMRLFGSSEHEPIMVDDGTLSEKLIENGEEVTMLGWGQVHSTSTAQTLDLQEGKVDLMSTYLCRKHWWGNYIGDEMFCAYRNGVSGCMGDSGGPIFFREEIESNVKDVLLGSISWGSGGCNYPTVFSNSAFEHEWIIQNINLWSNGEACHNYQSLDNCESDSTCTWKTELGECSSS